MYNRNLTLIFALGLGLAGNAFAQNSPVQETISQNSAIELNQLIETSSFDDLVKSSESLSLTEIETPSASIWKKYIALVRADSSRQDAMNKKALVDSDKTMKFSLNTKGEKPGWKAPSCAASRPYAYCSKDSCRTVFSPITFFFDRLPANVENHCVEPDAYAMTFDDGPAESYPKVLEILARKDVKATFFVLGSKISGETEKGYLKAAFDGGHQISNHSFNHKDLMSLTDEELLGEINNTEEAIVSTLGESESIRAHAKIVRPPFGYINDRVQGVLEKNGNRTVRWSSDRSDWELSSSESDKALELKRLDQHIAYASSLKANGQNPSILDLNHDFSGATGENLEIMIDKIRTAGYRFVTVSECLNPSPRIPEKGRGLD